VRVLVTGGAGYLGRVCAAHLVENGHDVCVVDDLSTGHRDAVPDGCEFVAGDVAEAAEAAVPGLRIDLVTAATLPEELELLATGRADAAFLWVPTGDERLRFAEVRADRRMVALPAGHRLAGRAAVTLADLAGEPVVVPEVEVAEEVTRHWLAEPRPDGRPAPRGPRAHRIEDRLVLVARGRGVWLAPEPLSRYFPMPHVVWVPVEDAAPSHLALVWTARSPEALMVRLAAEVRAVTGWTGAAQEAAPPAGTPAASGAG
jgi:NAD(P)-dependent dehydrogenase (short-subunit alcohol dehydrogenase family)